MIPYNICENKWISKAKKEIKAKVRKSTPKVVAETEVKVEEVKKPKTRRKPAQKKPKAD